MSGDFFRGFGKTRQLAKLQRRATMRAADDAAFLAANRLMLRNTAFGNFFDLTGLSLPMPGLPRPAGLMLLARHGQDRRLLAIGAGIEAALAG